jgi:uncharacterized membrane protein
LGNTGNGVKAGLIAGIVYGIVLGIFGYFTVVSDKSTVLAAIASRLPANSPFTADQLYGIVVLVAPAFAAVSGVIGGIIIGAVYGRLYERIPGRTSTVKGLVVGIVMWLLISVIGGAQNLQYGVLVYLTGVGVGVIGALLFGFLLGYLFGWFSRAPKVDPATAGL